MGTYFWHTAYYWRTIVLLTRYLSFGGEGSAGPGFLVSMFYQGPMATTLMGILTYTVGPLSINPVAAHPSMSFGTIRLLSRCGGKIHDNEADTQNGGRHSEQVMSFVDR